MKAEIIFCRNAVMVVEHIRIDLKAETKKDEEDLNLLRQTGLVAASAGLPPEVLLATLYLPAKKEVVA